MCCQALPDPEGRWGDGLALALHNLPQPSQGQKLLKAFVLLPCLKPIETRLSTPQIMSTQSSDSPSRCTWFVDFILMWLHLTAIIGCSVGVNRLHV